MGYREHNIPLGLSLITQRQQIRICIQTYIYFVKFRKTPEILALDFLSAAITK